MGRAKPLLWLALATLMVAPSKARARSRAYASASAPPQQRQDRRRTERGRPVSVVSPCGQHVAKVARGAVFVDGARVHPDGGPVQVLRAPIWRRDGRALAWIERRDGQTRLVVVHPSDNADALAWSLPDVARADRVFWAGPHHLVVGPGLLHPRAIARFSP